MASAAPTAGDDRSAGSAPAAAAGQHILQRVIAVTGCDGSGKTTLTADLLTLAASRGPARLVYLGQSSGNIKRALATLPIVGPRIARGLEARAKRVHDPRSGGVGETAAVVIYLLSRWRAHKFRRVLRLARHNTIVVTDRWPQAELPGFPLDGPGLGGKPANGPLARGLAAREQRLYAWMAAHVPALVIRLDVDVDTAHARKPDHALEILRRKTSLIPTLCFHGARILALDARRPYAEVRAAATRAVVGILEAARDDR